MGRLVHNWRSMDPKWVSFGKEECLQIEIKLINYSLDLIIYSTLKMVDWTFLIEGRPLLSASFEVLQIVWLCLAAVDLLKLVSWGNLFLILLIILIHFEGRGRFNKLHLIVRVEISRNLLGDACLRIVVQRSAYLLTSVNGRLGVFGFLYWVDRIVEWEIRCGLCWYGIA